MRRATTHPFVAARLEEFSLAVKIRLARHGAKKHPYYRVVVADGRKPRDGRFIEQVGTFNPLTDPKTINLDLEKIDAWVAKGAQPSNAVSHLIGIVRDGDKPQVEKKAKKSKKQAAKDAAAKAEPEPEPEAAAETAE
jgi:small subunit ribosomal protein S16